MTQIAQYMVVFERYLGSDDGDELDPPVPSNDADRIKQLQAELQEAFDAGHLAGWFKIESRTIIDSRESRTVDPDWERKRELIEEFEENAVSDAADYLREHGIAATRDWIDGRIAEIRRGDDPFDPDGTSIHNYEVARDRLVELDWRPCDDCGKGLVDPSLQRAGEDFVICDNCRDEREQPRDHEHCREIGRCWQDAYPCPALTNEREEA